MNKIRTFKIRTQMLICILCVCGCSFSAFAQGGKRITGTVADVTGEPIIGANVVEKGWRASVLYHISVSSNGKVTAEELSVHDVRNARLIFTPSVEMKKSLEGLSFEIEHGIS